MSRLDDRMRSQRTTMFPSGDFLFIRAVGAAALLLAAILSTSVATPAVLIAWTNPL